MFKVESYYSGGSGPYWRVLQPSGQVAGQMIRGVPYPCDGYQTKAAAQQKADRLNNGNED